MTSKAIGSTYRTHPRWSNIATNCNITHFIIHHASTFMYLWAVVLQLVLIRADIEENPKPNHSSFIEQYVVPSLERKITVHNVSASHTDTWVHYTIYVAPCSQGSPTPSIPSSTDPHSPTIQANCEHIKVLHCNSNGLRGCIQEIIWFLEKHHIRVAALYKKRRWHPYQT